MSAALEAKRAQEERAAARRAAEAQGVLALGEANEEALVAAPLPAALARRKYPQKGLKNTKPPAQGFGLGFEQIFKTTSIKLPVSAYSVFVELKLMHNGQTLQRCFNGIHTVYDLKKWIFEVALLSMDAYEISYAEPGKARIDDNLRLLTTQDSLDVQSLASMRAVHGNAKGVPGVHSIDSSGVTRLYLRLKCRTTGELKCNLATTRRPILDQDLEPVLTQAWYRPDPRDKAVFDTVGYEIYEASQAVANGCSEIAQITLGMEPPSEILKLERMAKLRS
jgi:hypothetical protein